MTVMEKIKTAAALGLFDGVHLGHRAVLAAAAEQEKTDLFRVLSHFRLKVRQKRAQQAISTVNTRKISCCMIAA